MAGASTGAAAQPREPEARFLVAQPSQTLVQAYERAAARGDFGMAPGRILESLRDRYCGSPQRGADECRGLLFAYLQERFALPEEVTSVAFWSMLARIDAEFDRLVTSNPRSHSDAEFLAVHERFREARRDIAGAALDRRLFGLSDDLLDLPQRVGELAGDSRMPLEQKLAAYQDALQRIEHEHGVRLMSVMEPVELARHELRIREAADVLGPEQRREVLERYTGPEYARRYLDYHQEQQTRSERLKAFNQERDLLLKQLASESSPEQLRQRMLAVDQRLFEKYDLQ
ncbi:lipase secretion chaperone [Archangium lansingense]|uniref:Lipase helper protein n=1 Tax=Archangium lansingense TaxID=2995310 RepID=A0ABT4A6P8_9BACT|nr:lipase secretion chaperone [Archangium lansinium]MCY1077330.1 lipase secretion chaperone [Archangium lansinium]